MASHPPHPTPGFNIPFTNSLLEYHREESSVITIGILQKFIPETRDGWSYISDILRDYFERIMVGQVDINELENPPVNIGSCMNT